ncbi:MAG: mechanosensitive ion channel [Bacteroidetes bacterium]|nr:mechanosensitive ion channel [Bacteroidota bacterium]
MQEWLIPASIVAGAVLAAIILEWLVPLLLKKLSKGTTWKDDLLFFKPLRGFTAIFIILIGAWFAVLEAPLSPIHLFYTRKVLKILAVFAGTIALAKTGVGLVRYYTRSIHHSVLATSILITITRIVIFSIGLLIILQLFGISITPMLTALGVGGLAIALAMQDTLSNLFAGFHVIISRNIRPGDYIKLDSGQEGTVSDINWRNTIIRSPANNIIIVPNSKISGAIITNFTLPADEVVFMVAMTVPFSGDPEKVEQVAVEAATITMREEKGGVGNFIPVVRFNAFTDSGISFNIILRAENYDSQFSVKHAFIKRLHKLFRQAGLEPAVPVRKVITGKETE